MARYEDALLARARSVTARVQLRVAETARLIADSDRLRAKSLEDTARQLEPSPDPGSIPVAKPASESSTADVS